MTFKCPFQLKPFYDAVLTSPSLALAGQSLQHRLCSAHSASFISPSSHAPYFHPPHLLCAGEELVAKPCAAMCRAEATQRPRWAAWFLTVLSSSGWHRGNSGLAVICTKLQQDTDKKRSIYFCQVLDQACFFSPRNMPKQSKNIKQSIIPN